MIASIIALGPGEANKSAADKQPPSRDPGTNPLFTYRKVQLARMANSEKDNENQAELAMEDKHSLEELPSSSLGAAADWWPCSLTALHGCRLQTSSQLSLHLTHKV